MSFAHLSKTKLTLQVAMSESWEDKYPNKCPLLLNIVGWAFVFASFFFI
ncbi:hypothetical protein P7M36_02110 [Vibrio parahaemolyticus]|nr:hypothetical protein [Vibrio alginolyticus]MDG2633522.1 hypothetical protein [Vibrio parahaemolyticus]HCH1217039.1 hypothetical protein [Vibrio parahaemolyticus]HEQ3533761.1 hypothetical protein [Vibrio parahaemolyticus]